jgi:hypothetical protein
VYKQVDRAISLDASKKNEGIRQIIKTSATSQEKILGQVVKTPSLKRWKGTCVYGWMMEI